MKTDKGRNSKTAANGIAKMLGELRAEKVKEYAARVEGGGELVTVTFTREELNVIRLAAGRHDGGDLEAYIKDVAQSRAASDLEELAFGLCKGSVKVVETEEQ